MYEELIKSLRANTEKCNGYPLYCNYCNSCVSYGCDAILTSKAADAIEKLQDTAQAQDKALKLCADQLARRWISVEERLPEEKRDGFSDDVLMLIEEPDGDITWRDVYVGYYLYDAVSDETGWWVKMTCDCTKVGEHKHGNKIFKADERVTHWMPLPEPPKDEESPIITKASPASRGIYEKEETQQ